LTPAGLKRRRGWWAGTTARLALLAAIVVFLANLAALALLYVQIRDDAIDRLRRDVAAQTDALEAAYRGGGKAGLSDAISDLRQSDDPMLVVGLYRGDRLSAPGPGAPAKLPFRAVSTPFAIATIGPDQPEAAYILRRVGPDWLLSGRLVDERQRMQRTLERAVILSGLLSILLGVAGSIVIIVYVTRRLRVIAVAVERVAEGDLSRRAVVTGSSDDAFDALAGGVNHMLDRIEALLGELRLMTDSFAHDLRSPLARLRTQVERAAIQADTPAAASAMEAALGEADRMMRMLTTLLQIGRAGAMTAGGDLPAIAPGSLLAELAELYEPLAEDAGVVLTLEVGDTPPLPLHRDLMSQAISNLIDNALRYGAPGGALRLGAAVADGAVVLSVSDTGPGIAADQLAEARRRFGRLDTARSHPGAGLGIALVEAVAHMHGGRLELGDAGPGLAARIVLPVR